jgi:hypothetical protein
MNDASAEAARQALDEYFRCWNTAEIAAVRAALNYPHIAFGQAGQVTVASTPDEFADNFAALRQREGWHHSTLDSFTVLSSAETKVHCEVEYSRYRDDGARYGGGRIFYIVTNHAGHWGMQFLSPLPNDGPAATPSRV